MGCVVNYSDAISRAFRTLKAGSPWGFIASSYAAIVGLFVLALTVGIAALGGTARLVQTFAAISSSSRTPTLHEFAPVFVLWALAVGVSLLSIPIAVAQYGGTIHLTDEIQAGRDARVGDGWAFGFRRFWRVVAVELVIGLITFALVTVVIAPIVTLAVAAAKTNGSAGAVVGLVCGGMLLVLALVFGVLMISGFEAIAIRYALIGDRTAGDALTAGWAAFKARFKNVFAFVLIIVGFAIIFSIAQTVLNYVIRFATIGSLAFSGSPSGLAPASLSALVSRALPVLVIIYIIELALAAAVRLFQASMWTAFFRQMTGLDVAQPRSGYIPPYGYAPEPGPRLPEGSPPAPLAPGGYPPPPTGWAPPVGSPPDWPPGSESAPLHGGTHDSYAPPMAPHRSALDPNPPMAPHEGEQQ